MLLKRLEVHGFKTFANRTDFQFNPGITAVVGPNGSGKSNVADGIRWSLGEQSYSALRTKKTEDLIFGGSAARPRMGMAEVAITLENPFAFSDSLPEAENSNNGNGAGETRVRPNIVEEILRAKPSEVTILRRAYRSGENEYLVNRQRVRLRDVQELLQRWGLARNTYAVVGQGLIDAALALRPEERRALFEEAAGIGLYQSKKQNALEKLEETQRNLLRVNDIVNEIAPRLPSLARQADRARRYESVATSLSDKLKQWYAYQWARSREHFARAASAESEAREKQNAQREQMRDLASRLADARREAQVLRARLQERRRARAARESEYAARERELAVLEERVRFAEQQAAEAEREIEGLTSTTRSYAAQVASSQTNRAELENQRARAIARKRLGEARIVEMEAARASAPRGASVGDARDLARRLIELQHILPLYEQALPSVSRLASRAEALARHELTRREREQLVDRARGEWGEAKTALALVERDVQAAQLAIKNARDSLNSMLAQVEAKRSRAGSHTRQLEASLVQRDRLRGVVETLARELESMTADVSPDESRLLTSERLQNELEEQEATARSQLSDLEGIYNRAVLDAERSRAEIARLESEIEDDLGAVELDSGVPQQLRLRLVLSQAPMAASGEVDGSPEAAQQELVVLPEVTTLPDNFEREIRRLKNQMKYIGNVNPGAPQEFDELKQRHAFLTDQASDLTEAIERLHRAIAELDELMKERFKETFDAINVEFKKFFTLLFGGGTARLELTDPENLVQTGIEISAKPPGKRAAHLAILSGGERALTACALLFAILKASPTPFCVLDEVDAMLDEANVGRFRDALKELSSETQFIVITHNRATIESASTVYGISMGDDGVSQVISLRLADAITRSSEEPLSADLS
jgi:chromosome segregation protein